MKCLKPIQTILLFSSTNLLEGTDSKEIHSQIHSQYKLLALILNTKEHTSVFVCEEQRENEVYSEKNDSLRVCRSLVDDACRAVLNCNLSVGGCSARAQTNLKRIWGTII